MSDLFDPEAKDMLMQLMGQTYGELHKLDNFIVSPSQQLKPKSEEFKQTVANVTRSLNANVAQPQQRIARPAAMPVDVLPASLVSVDPNQLEFGFDNTATAVAIDKSIARVEDKVDKLIKLVNKLLEQHKK
jgi:hypothetical protein